CPADCAAGGGCLLGDRLGHFGLALSPGGWIKKLPSGYPTLLLPKGGDKGRRQAADLRGVTVRRGGWDSVQARCAGRPAVAIFTIRSLISKENLTFRQG